MTEVVEANELQMCKTSLRTQMNELLPPRKTIVIAGASGFVGKALSQALMPHYKVIGLSRSAAPPNGMEWRRCDLFSLLETERALESADIGIYLVHSMLPSSRLSQGRFEDFDAIVADNFGKAARKNDLKQIIYLGGLINEGEKSSPHLKSRLEVERILQSSGVPTTGIRAGLIVGPGGSSFEILKHLVERLPLMLLPRWTRIPTQPIALEDIIELIRFCISNEGTYHQSFDVGGPDRFTYAELIHQTATALGRKIRAFSVPFFSPGLSSLWVSLITGASYSLVAPLVQSLKHPMLAKDDRLQKMAGLKGRTFAEALQSTLQKDSQIPSRLQAMKESTRSIQKQDTVRSIQRLPQVPHWSAADVVDEYLRWLPGFFKFLIQVRTDQSGSAKFYFLGISKPVLVLDLDPTRSQSRRALLRIRGGLLVTEPSRGRLEFRDLEASRAVLAAIHEFQPRLPWLIYRWTQAPVHAWVMSRFRKHLFRLGALSIDSK